MAQASHKALIVGGLGVSGRHLATELAARPNWDVLSVARSAPPATVSLADRVQHLRLDACDPQACRQLLAQHRGITHLFYCARQDHPQPSEEVRLNNAMLTNVLDALAASSPGLQHVMVMHGMKAYGTLVGPFRTPARETDPRLPVTLSYYAQEDLLRERCAQSGWSWSTLRPGPIMGITLGYSGNLVQILGVWGSICRELGMPLWFPGTEAGFNSLRQGCDVRLLAKAAVWTATHESCANQAFNVSNGDLFRWERLWPEIAAFFGLEPGPVFPMRLRDFMRDKDPLWNALVERHGLQPNPFSAVASWGYADTFHNGWDSFSTDLRLRATGFSQVSDTSGCLLGLLAQLRGERIIP